MKFYLFNRYRNTRYSALKFIFCLLAFCAAQQTAAQSLVVNHEAKLSKTVTLTAIDNFTLSGQLNVGLATSGGVLLLHDCQHIAKDFQPLHSALVKQGLFVLSLDLRGFGASQNEDYSHKSIRLKAGDIVSYQGKLAALMLHWESDVLSAYQYLQRTMNNNQSISIVTSGCSSNQAIYLAQKTALKSVVMLSPELSVDDKEQFKHLPDMPIYLLSAKYLTEAMLNAQELFDWSGDRHSVLQTFKGNGSSYYLLKQQTYLNENIAIWLNSTLSTLPE
mgnify:FL=1